jgi:hypothetical protein
MAPPTTKNPAANATTKAAFFISGNPIPTLTCRLTTTTML